jgi:protein-disulfide isomerase
VRFSFRQFAFIGDESQWAAEASECASEQGKFWDYYDKIFEEQAGENVGAYSKDNLKLFAGDLGLDRGQFDQCLDSGKYAEKVRQETVLGREAGVRSTPALFVNGQLIEGGANYEILKSAVEAELTK